MPKILRLKKGETKIIQITTPPPKLPVIIHKGGNNAKDPSGRQLYKGV